MRIKNLDAAREREGKEMVAYRIPESFKAFCKIVSLTAAKTSRMLVVSVAWVRLKEQATISDRYCKSRK